MTICCPHCARAIDLTVTAMPPPPPSLFTLDDMDVLTMRVYNALGNVGISNARDAAVIPDSHLLRIKNFGEKSLRNLRALVPHREDRAAWAELQVWMDQYQRLPGMEQYAALRRRARLSLENDLSCHTHE